MKRSGNSLKWIISKSSGQKLNLFLLVFFSALFSVVTVAFAYVIKIVVDGAVEGDMKLFTLGAIIIVSLIVLQFFLRLLISGLTEHIKGKLEIIYKSAIFSAILRKKYQKIFRYHSGELMNRLTADVSVVADGVSSILPTVVSSVTRLITAIIVLCFIDWLFALAFVVAGLLVFTVMGLLRGKLKNLHKKAQETDGKTRSFMQESIENVLAIKVFSVQDKTSQIAQNLQEDNFKVKMKRRNYAILGHSTYNFIFSAGYIFALIFGGLRIIGGALGYGDLSAILQLVNSVQVPFASLSGVLPKVYATTASAERLIEIENIEEDQCLNKVDVKQVYSKLKNIVADNISFSYDGKETVYENASLSIEKGKSLAIVGASGIGKSTIMKLLLGVYPLSDGSMYFDCDGKQVLVDEQTRSMFSYVPQGNMLFSGTIKDNVTLVNTNATDEQIEFALKTSCAYDFVQALPNKLDTVVGENGTGLSEGQVQRLAIARAVLCGAPVMLLDEATGSLDEQTERKVIANLLSLQDTTVILVSHRHSVADMCDRIVKVQDKGFKCN